MSSSFSAFHIKYTKALEYNTLLKNEFAGMPIYDGTLLLRANRTDHTCEVVSIKSYGQSAKLGLSYPIIMGIAQE